MPLSGDRGEGNALFEVRTNDLKTLQGMHSLAFGQSAQRLGTGSSNDPSKTVQVSLRRCHGYTYLCYHAMRQILPK